MDSGPRPPRESPIDRRRDQRRAAVARACLDRLALEGYADARLEALATDAGLSRQNLLFYFRDKSDLWAESAACAAEDIFRVLTRLVAGEAGPAAIRATRRGLDEVSRVLPSAFAVLLDSAATASRASAPQQQRATDAQSTFLAALSSSVGFPSGPTEPSAQLSRLTWLTLLAHHREARAHERSGLTGGLPLAADLDYAEVHLVAMARALSTRGR